MTTAQDTDVTADSESLRQAMVDRLIINQQQKGRTLRPEVEAALRVVPRHLFAPDASLEEAYDHDAAVITKRRGSETISSVSAPWLQTEMIEQAADALGTLLGKHVLEIGSGGYNAALLRELVGELGSVTTIDIDSDVTDRASKSLDAAGYGDVMVVCADADQPIEPTRQYDLIMVTVGAWDISPSWTAQLSEGGVLVVPLRTFAMTRSWALRKEGDELASQSRRLCGFVSMQGTGAHEVRFADIAEGVHLRMDEDEQVDATAVASLLSQPREYAWAGLSLPPRTVLADLDLWLALYLGGESDQFVVLTATQEAIDSGTVDPAWRFGTPALVSPDTFAYRSAPSWTDRVFDLGSCAHGPQAAAVAGRMADSMRAWVAAGTPAPVLRVLPATTPDGDLPTGTVLNKAHTRLVLTFTP